MKGGVKKFPSVVNKPKSRVSTVFKPRKTHKRKYYLIKPKRFKTLKRKIEKEVDDSDLGQLKSYKLCLAFIEKFLKKYETVMNSGNVEKESNYSMFATILAASLSQVNEEYKEIVDESDLLNNNNVMNILTKNPDEYLENYIEYVEEEDVIDDYEKAIEKYFNSFNKNKMNINNNNSEQEYITYSSFIRDSVSAVKDTIKKYSSELKTKKKIANNVNIDDLIMGLTVMKIKGSTNSSKSNVVLTNDFLNKFIKLGL
jgi:hypothetical protein